MDDLPGLTFTPEWYNYPRVRFFKDRYMRLYTRFKNVIDTFPKSFHDDELMRDIKALNDDLGHSPRVLITGVTDITNKDIVISADKQESRVTKHNVAGERADSTDVKLSGGRRRNDGPSVFIHFIDITGNGSAEQEEQGIQALREIIEKYYILRRIHWANIIVFRTNEINTKSDTETLTNCLQLELHRHRIENFNMHIMLNPTHQELPSQISLVFEKRLIDTFIRMFSDLKRFMRLDRRYDLEDSNIPYSKEIFTSIENIICNKYKLDEIFEHEQTEQLKHEESEISKQGESKDNILELTSSAGHQMPTKTHMDKIIRDICNSITCASTAPLAAKFNLRESCCHQMLMELQFEDRLINSISEKTGYYLSDKFEKELTVCSKDDVEVILEDISEVFVGVERKLKRMDQVVTVMRKMAFEIKGYLSQSDVAQNFEDEMFHSKPIPQSLREDIFRIKGVYSLATVYGELEIGLTPDAPSEATEDAKKILQKHMYRYTHKIKRMENLLTLYAGATPLVFEQGDTLLSPNPDIPNESRMGTLGACLQGSDNVSYGLTCAHVRDTANEEVEVKKQCDTSPTIFGSIYDEMMVSQTEESCNIRVVDIAAVSIKNCNSCCYKILDDQIKHKPAMFAVSDQVDNLTGMHVYKHGAQTAYTEGIVMSSDCYMNTPNSQSKFTIVEALPAATEGANNHDSGIFTDNLLGINNSVVTNSKGTATSECIKQEHFHDSLLDDSSFYDEIDQPGSDITDDIEQELHSESRRQIDHSIVPKPEIDESQLESVRDSEMMEVIPKNASRTRKCLSKLFADEGDSGALVCMTDLDADAVLVVSMVSAGDSTSKNPICVSLPIENQMYEITRRIVRNKPGFHFSMPPV